MVLFPVLQLDKPWLPCGWFGGGWGGTHLHGDSHIDFSEGSTLVLCKM
jgi:hypothetical protein